MLIKYKCENNPAAHINIEKLDSGKNKITVELEDKTIFMPYKNWETNYNTKLIEEILHIKGPAYLCDEIMRDESPNYVQKSLKYNLLGYVDAQDFEDKRILDFGCGSGSSTVIIARMLPKTKIVGIDLEEKLLKLAKSRAKYYGFNNLEFLLSPNGDSLPENIGKFDFIILSAVYEHLLPHERTNLLTKMWDLLNDNGILFINGTPYRYFPIETHTTGLPLLNYLPNKLACWCAQNLSKRNLKNENWEDLLRRGIRGATVKEIINILKNASKFDAGKNNACKITEKNNTSQSSTNKFDANKITEENKNTQDKKNSQDTKNNGLEILKPKNFGIRDGVDLWDKETTTTRYKFVKKILYFCFKFLKVTTGVTFVPYVSVTVKRLN